LLQFPNGNAYAVVGYGIGYESKNHSGYEGGYLPEYMR